jgi:hypothetical protein
MKQMIQTLLLMNESFLYKEAFFTLKHFYHKYVTICVIEILNLLKIYFIMICSIFSIFFNIMLRKYDAFFMLNVLEKLSHASENFT